MEALLTLVGCSVPFALLAGVAWLVSKLLDLGKRVRQLEEQVALLTRGASAPRPSLESIAQQAVAVPDPPQGAAEALPPDPPPPPAIEVSPLDPREVQAMPPPPAAVPTFLAEAQPAFDWERWLGVRGAAVGGGVLLALAGLYFFQYSIERGWISPLVRLLIGAGVGLLALAGSSRLRARSYLAAGAALAGGGFAILYAVVWAAHRMYGLLSAWPAFGLMAVLTAGCCLLAARYGSLVVAALGLLGGFAAPLAIPGAAAEPIALFGYLLLLDADLLLLAARRRWPLLGTLALAATSLHQLAFLLARLESGNAPLFLGLLALVAVLFVALARDRGAAGEGEEAAPSWLAPQAAGVLAPAGLALFAATSGEIDVPLPLLAGTLIVLSAAACWVAKAWRGKPESAEWLASAGAGLAAAAFGAWVVSHHAELPGGYLVVLAAFALAAVPSIFHWRGAERDPGPSFTPLTLSFVGLTAVLVLASTFDTQAATPWAWLGGSLGLLLGLGTAGWRLRRIPALGAAPLLVAPAFLAPLLAHLGEPSFPPASLWLGLGLALCAGVAGLAWSWTRSAEGEEAGTTMLWGSSLAALALIVLGTAPAVQSGALALPAFAALLLAATALVLGVAVALPAGALAFAGTLGSLLVLGLASLVAGAKAPHPDSVLLALGGALGALLVAVPLGTRLGTSSLARAGVLAVGPALFLALQGPWEDLTGPRYEGGLAALLAVAYALAFLGAKHRPGAPARPGLALCAIAFVTLALPLQLDGTALTLAWAVEALALLALGVAQRTKRLRQLGLAVLVGALLKLFLYDLAALQDLARVASLVGLAISLLLVSVGYQRWISRLEEPSGADEAPDDSGGR